MLAPVINRVLRIAGPKLDGIGLQISAPQGKELSWLAGGQLVSVFLSLISIKLITSIGAEEYGKFVLATSVSGLLSLTFFGPMEQGFVRLYFDYRDSEQSRSVFSNTLLRLLSWSAGVLAVLAVVFILFAHSRLKAGTGFTAAAAIMVLLAALNVPLSGMINAFRLRKEGAIIQVAERSIVIMLVAAIFFRQGLNVTGVIGCVAFASAVSLLLRFRVYRKALPGTIPARESAAPDHLRQLRREILQKIAVYSQPFVLWGILAWMQSNGERWVINGMLPGADLGRYGLAASLVNNSVVVVFAMLTQFMTPIIFAKFSTNGSTLEGMRLIRLYGWATSVMFLSVGIVLLFAGDPVIRLISTSQFTIGGPVLFSLTIGLGAYSVGQSLTQVGLALRRPEIYIVPKVVTAVLSVGAYLLGCRWGGIVGVVGAIVFVNMLYLLLVYLANKRFLAAMPVAPEAAQ